MKHSSLSAICQYVSARTGSALSRQQVGRLEDAIARRQGSRDAHLYFEHLKSMHGAAELAELMSVISVHKTDLFRDEVQLEAVRTRLLPALLAERSCLRVWSAGCATGEEVATLLILLAESGADRGSTVLGTDIAAGALLAAEHLTFASEAMRRVPAPIRERYFLREGSRFALVRELSSRALWLRHNLMDQPFPLPAEGGGFDLIVCRNVLIYFTESAWEQVVAGLVERLRPGGTLVLGAAEPLLGKSDQLEVLRHPQAFFYRRRRAGEAPVEPPRPRKATPPAPAPSAPSSTSSWTALPAVEVDPRTEGERLFELVLEWSAAGQPDDQTEAGLRKALYLAPELAPARYLLGMLAEQRGANADATSEYRRALAMLCDGKSQQAPFYLNAERLKRACERALERLGYR